MFFKTVINKGVVNKVLYSKIGKGKEVNEGKDRKRKESSKPIQDYINPMKKKNWNYVLPQFVWVGY